MHATRHTLRKLLGTLALAVLTAGLARAGDTPFANYAAAGARDGEAIEGNVRFGTETSYFVASFNESPRAPGISYQLFGDYAELDLFLIGFWSFVGDDNQGGGSAATGSGIRLLFGLLVFGSLEDSQGVAYSFSGGFTGVVNALPEEPTPERLVPVAPSTRLAARSDRRPLAPERG